MEISLKALHSRDFGFVCLSLSFFCNVNRRCGRVNPVNTHPASHSIASPAGVGENRRQVRRFMEWDGGLIQKAKVVYMSKADKLTCYFPLAGSCLATSRKAQPQHRQRLPGKTSTITTNIPSSSFFPWYFIAEHAVMWYGTLLQSIWTSSHSYVPSQPFAHPLAYSPGVGRAERISCHWGSSVQ